MTDEYLIQEMAELWTANKGDANGFYMLQDKIFDAILKIETEIEI